LFDAAETSESSASLIAPYPNNVSVSVGQKATFRCTISVSSSGSSSSSSRLPRVQVNSVQCAPGGRNQKFAGRGLLFSHLFRHFPSFLFPSLPFIFLSLPLRSGPSNPANEFGFEGERKTTYCSHQTRSLGFKYTKKCVRGRGNFVLFRLNEI